MYFYNLSEFFLKNKLYVQINSYFSGFNCPQAVGTLFVGGENEHGNKDLLSINKGGTK